jgi:hypothetical protein
MEQAEHLINNKKILQVFFLNSNTSSVEYAGVTIAGPVGV